MKKVALLPLLLLLLLLPTTAFASNVLVDGKAQQNYMYSDTTRSYTINLTKPERITIKLESEVSKLRVDFKEANGTDIAISPKYLSSGRKGNPQIQLYEFDLAAGQYIIDLTARYGSSNGYISVMYDTQKLQEPANAINLAFNEQRKGFLVQRSAGDTYKIKVPQDGHLNLLLNGLLRKETSYELLDANANILATGVKKSSTTSAAQFNERYSLSKGTYYIRVYNRLADNENNTGNYTIKTTFSSSPAVDKEPNNSFEEAETIYFGQNMTGFLGLTDTTDYFAISVKSAGKVSVNLTSKLPMSTTVTLFNDKQTRLMTKTHNTSETNPYTFNLTFEAVPGTYYVNVSSPKQLAAGGEYTFTVLGQGITAFTDYKMGEYWTSPFAWATNENIIKGVGNRLLPYQPVNEAQMLAMTFRYMFDARDTNGNWYDGYYQLAVQEGIAVRNQPYATVRRGDAAKMLTYLYTGMHVSESSAIAWLYDNGITTAPTASQFNPNTAMTRGHLVTFMYRAYANGLAPYR